MEAGHEGPEAMKELLDSKSRKPLTHSQLSNICFVFLEVHSGCRCKETWRLDQSEGELWSTGKMTGGKGRTGVLRSWGVGRSGLVDGPQGLLMDETSGGRGVGKKPRSG